MMERKEACLAAILQAARDMCLAAQTAPKACGRDSVECGVLTGEEIAALAEEMGTDISGIRILSLKKLEN